MMDFLKLDHVGDIYIKDKLCNWDFKQWQTTDLLMYNILITPR